jgi:hypothetical protein
VAFPLACVGLLLLSRRTLRTDTARITATVAARSPSSPPSTPGVGAGSGEGGTSRWPFPSPSRSSFWPCGTSGTG